MTDFLLQTINKMSPRIEDNPPSYMVIMHRKNVKIV